MISLFITFINLDNALGGRLRLVESPRANLSLKQLVQLGRRATVPTLEWDQQNGGVNKPGSFGNQEPHGYGEGQAQSCVEPARLETPVPLVGVDHVRSEDVHDDAGNTCRRSAETSCIGSQALR